MGSGRGRAEWARKAWGEPGAGGSGERAEGTATRIPILSHFPYCRSHLSQAEHSPPSGIRLRGSNSPTHRNYSAPPCLTPAAEEYSWMTLTLQKTCRQRQIAGSSEASADLPQVLVPVKANCGAQPHSFRTHPGPAKGATHCGF